MTRAMPLNASALSMDKLRREGWTVERVEHHDRHSLVTHDLFGFVDLLALRPDQTLAVQVTTTRNQSKRIAKVLESPHLSAVRAAGWLIHVHGWHLSTRSGEWVCTTTDLTQEG